MNITLAAVNQGILGRNHLLHFRFPVLLAIISNVNL